MYALSTLIFLAVFALLVLNNVMTNGKKEKRI
jgi:hypothetical protein